MATAQDFRRIAVSPPGTIEAPHFERTAFNVRRIYATLAPDGCSANFMFSPDEQALKCEVAPQAFSRLPNAWGARGATTALLSALSEAALRDALEIAWRAPAPNGAKSQAVAGAFVTTPLSLNKDWSSPDWNISRMMSQPPTNSPLT
jgi:hypothetical protein